VKRFAVEFLIISVAIMIASFWAGRYFRDKVQEAELIAAYTCGRDDATRNAQREALNAGFNNYPASYEKFTENFKNFPLESEDCHLFHVLHLPK
jgi:hypothetical protein